MEELARRKVPPYLLPNMQNPSEPRRRLQEMVAESIYVVRCPDMGVRPTEGDLLLTTIADSATEECSEYMHRCGFGIGVPPADSL